VPESGWSTPTLYGLAWPNASRHGAGTSIVAPRAPAVADVSARNLRRGVLPLHHMSFAQGSSCHRSAIGFLLAVPRHANTCATATVMSGKRIAPTYTNPPPRARVHLPSPHPKPHPVHLLTCTRFTFSGCPLADAGPMGQGLPSGSMRPVPSKPNRTS